MSAIEVDAQLAGPVADGPPEERDEIDDATLEALALAADPDAAIPDDARPLDEVLGVHDAVLVPGWYMPPSRGRLVRRGWRRRVVWTIVAAFVAINGYGLCSTYGKVDLAGVERIVR